MGKLPRLPEDFTGHTEQALRDGHTAKQRETQGRGLWPSQLYAEVKLEGRLGEVVDELREAVKDRHASFSDLTDHGSLEGRRVHISLSRPLHLTQSEHEPMLRQSRIKLGSFAPLKINFVTLSRLRNDQKTRTFLVLEIGAGHPGLHQISRVIDEIGLQYGQPVYYQDGSRFHASLFSSTDPSDELFSSALVEDLNGLFRDKLALLMVEVRKVIFKIGKTLHSIPLEGY